jgi:hypothetical protein
MTASQPHIHVALQEAPATWCVPQLQAFDELAHMLGFDNGTHMVDMLPDTWLRQILEVHALPSLTNETLANAEAFESM